ncbi:GyrI-like domain-containing protein [Nocardioides sp. SOB44]|jgi:effector-binding domain-containing protein|uniref:GyrI-like domain-containing protein n=1 Tax=Nocardioides cremeus TaxID=3058044 RepID=A0ABT8TNZ9_9ACTN|nr:GyrI-like domain-containing protein [Nocardioides cremeus]MDO3395680.1 GyrI-like domain-containing protein [Nocardioides cremeus]
MVTSAVEIVTLAPQPALAVHGDVAPPDLPGFFGRAFSSVPAAAAAAGVELVGPPFGLFPSMPGETVEVEAGFPVSAATGATAGTGEAEGVHDLLLPGGEVAQALHTGPYDKVGETYAAMESWMGEQGMVPAGPPWESYVSDPEAEPDPEQWRTLVCWPVTRGA